METLSDYNFYLSLFGLILAFFDFALPSFTEKIEKGIDDIGTFCWATVKTIADSSPADFFKPFILVLFILYLIDLDLNYLFFWNSDVDNIVDILLFIMSLVLWGPFIIVAWILFFISLSPLIALLNKNTNQKALASIGFILAVIGMIPFLQNAT